MTTPAFRFTKAAIDALPPAPAGRRTYYRDTHPLVHGLGLQLSVTATGTKSFMVYRWVESRPERITLGRFPAMTVAMARKEASEKGKAIARGENPADIKRGKREELTLQDLFDEYQKRHIEVHSRRPDKPKANYRLYLSAWGSRKLSRITKADVLALHAKIGRENGKVTANIAVKLLRAMFNKAIEWELWKKGNPAKGVQLFPEQARDRFLQPDELPWFFEAVADEPNTTIRDYLLVSLLTGARRSNVLAMRWDELSLERGEWRVPMTKNGTPHTVPLVPEAVTILRARKPKGDAARTQEYVFPGAGAISHLVEPKKGWQRVLHRAELYRLTAYIAAEKGWSEVALRRARSDDDLRSALHKARELAATLKEPPQNAVLRDLRIHDLRRTLGSWQAATGASLPLIGKSLAHRNTSTTAIYARLHLSPVREAMEKAAGAMLTAGGVSNSSANEPNHFQVAAD